MNTSRAGLPWIWLANVIDAAYALGTDVSWGLTAGHRWFVDVGDVRYEGETLRAAFEAARVSRDRGIPNGARLRQDEIHETNHTQGDGRSTGARGR